MKHVKESARHSNAFESFLRYLQTLNTTQSIKKVAEEFKHSESGVWYWYYQYGWKQRAETRNQIIQEELEQENLEDIIKHRKRGLKITNNLLDYLDKSNGLRLKNVKDLDTLIRLQLLLLEQPTEITENSVVDREERLQRLKRIESTKNID